MVVISSQMCVFVHFHPLHVIHLATCFGELARFLICQNSTCIELRPLLPFGTSRLSESSLHLWRTRCKVKISFTVPSSSTVSSCCFDAYQPSSLEEIHSSDAHNALFGTEKTHLQAFQLPSLWLWLVLQTLRAVLVFRHRVAMNSHVTKQLKATVPVTLLHFHPCESLFAFLRSLFALAQAFRCLAHLRHFVTSLQLSEHQVKYVHH